MEKTRLALEKITSAKIQAAMPVRAADKQAPAQYIRYTPSQQGDQFNSGAKQRVIRFFTNCYIKINELYRYNNNF